ncbi:hypothetical protein [Amycolatopsis japonica]
MNDSERPKPNPLAPWPTLAERDAGASLEPELYEGVPPHLQRDLVAWVGAALTNEIELARKVANRFRISWTDTSIQSPRAALIRIVEGDLTGIDSPRPLDPLSVVDAIVKLHPGWDARGGYSYGQTKQQLWAEKLIDLLQLLGDTGSAWQLDAELRGLYRRVDPTATEAWRQARELAKTEGRPAAAEHLDAAWREIYGQHPDPTASYSAAVKAVEAVAVPVLAPGTSKTVHAAARLLRDNLDKWRFTLLHQRGLEPGTGSAEVVSVMLDRFLVGETGRHTSDDQKNRASTQAEAETAVHLAVILVQWFVSGAIRPSS